jgi:hypothetical protein
LPWPAIARSLCYPQPVALNFLRHARLTANTRDQRMRLDKPVPSAFRSFSRSDPIPRLVPTPGITDRPLDPIADRLTTLPDLTTVAVARPLTARGPRLPGPLICPPARALGCLPCGKNAGTTAVSDTPLEPFAARAAAVRAAGSAGRHVDVSQRAHVAALSFARAFR